MKQKLMALLMDLQRKVNEVMEEIERIQDPPSPPQLSELPMTNLTISEAGVNLIKKYEGLKLKAYLCPVGVPTIGYGHTKTVSAADVRNGKVITEQVADALLRADIKSFEKVVSKLIKVEINQNQFDALVSFVFNVGEGAFAKSTLLRKINAKDRSASDEFIKWVNGTVNGKKVQLPGLVKRRAEERDLFLKS